MRYLIGRYHEIALKGRNQWRFVDQLKQNLRTLFADCTLGSIRSQGPRIIVELAEDLPEATVLERASLLFGLQNFSIAREVPLDLEEMKREAVSVAREHACAKTFRIRTQRSEKRFPLTSVDVDREVGAAVKAAAAMGVDLENPELTIPIEVMSDGAWISAGKHPGAGGLPVGASGRAVALLSGGIDSPVAAYRMMRRGLRLDYVHFHSVPLLSGASVDKARELVAHLARYQGHATLMLVPFADIQRRIVAGTTRPLRVVLYRRFMMRIACAIANRTGAHALVTGESLGQVASQTLDNISVIGKASTLPILRPLLGMDKNEIVEQARKIRTFETSILPDQDCCTLFVPSHPETHADLREVEELESRFDIAAMVKDAVHRAEIVRTAFPPIDRSGRPSER
jgi:tRNA uracil 4-sulfurtransferase